jgi:hypothetical protein
MVRDALSAGTPVSGRERHLFTCPECLARVRVSLAWKSLPRPDSLEPAEAPDEIFVERVLDAVHQERRRRVHARVRLAAAAALLFFFFAGAGHRVASNVAAGAEDAYAQLVGSAGLDNLLPE